MNKNAWYVTLLAVIFTVIVALAIIAAASAVSIGALWVIFWCFSLQFTLKAAMGILLTMLLITITMLLITITIKLVI